MSRIRTGHGPEDWQDLPPAENSHRFSVGGQSVNLIGRKAPKNISMPSNADVARARARNAKRRVVPPTSSEMAG